MNGERPLPVLQAWDCGNGHNWACAEQRLCPVCRGSPRHREFGPTALPTWDSLQPEIKQYEQVYSAIWGALSEEPNVTVQSFWMTVHEEVEYAAAIAAPRSLSAVVPRLPRTTYGVAAQFVHDEPRDSRRVAGDGLTLDVATSAMLKAVEHLLVEWRAMRERGPA